MSDLSPDDLSSDASALLDAARGGFEPPAEAKSRLRRGLATAVGVATGAVTSGAAATSAAATAATGSAATATGLVAGGSATASVVTAAGTTATVATTSTVVGTGIGATLTAKVVVGLAVAASVAFGTVVVTNNLDGPAASVPSASAQPSVAPSAAPLAMVPKPVAEAVSVPTVTPPASVALPVAPEPPPLVRPTAPPSIVPTASLTVATVAATSAPAVRSDLAREAEMLRAALAAPPAQALALLDDHARQFPRGTLAEERDAQRVVTLCQLGRRSDAAASYTRFLSAFPASIHRARLDRTCAVTP